MDDDCCLVHEESFSAGTFTAAHAAWSRSSATWGLEFWGYEMEADRERLHRRLGMQGSFGGAESGKFERRYC